MLHFHKLLLDFIAGFIKKLPVNLFWNIVDPPHVDFAETGDNRCAACQTYETFRSRNAFSDP
jgi:hypothetical protein